jgi:hypothetical protein
MNDGFESLKVGMFDVAQIFANRREFAGRLAESALLEKVAIQADNFVTSIRQ